jgi:NADPH:quinone reductase-like Zn-dependent oxidoreductase
LFAARQRSVEDAAATPSPQVTHRLFYFLTDWHWALRPIIAKTFVFGRIVAAHRYLEAGEPFGKIVVPLESDS